jgi:hypothetical protein
MGSKMNHHKTRKKRTPQVARRSQCERYRDILQGDAAVVEVPTDAFFDSEGIARHLVASILSSISFLEMSGRLLGLRDDGVRLIEAALSYAAVAPADDPGLPNLLTEWVADSQVSLHFLALAAELTACVLDQIPRELLVRHFPTRRLAETARSIDAHRQAVVATLRPALEAVRPGLWADLVPTVEADLRMASQW